MNTQPRLPIELVFNPNWWRQTAGISFDEAFYLDPAARIANDVTMRRVLWQRYRDLGLGEADPQPRPVIGSLHVAGGLVIPALLGSQIRFAPDAAPQPLPHAITSAEIDTFEKPDWRTLWPMRDLLAQMDDLQAEYGYVVGDLNTDGVLNAAYHFYGQDLFADFYLAPERVRRFLDLIGELIVDVALAIRERTGSCSISVNRMVEHVDRRMFYHANCSVQMISPASYRQLHLPVEQAMASRIQPFGIHHCGANLQKVAASYAELEPAMVDVGWGSDVAAVAAALPDTFLNLRLSPIRMLRGSPQEIAADTKYLLQAADSPERTGLCCINMDDGTPDDNIFAMAEVVERFRRAGS
ncbi:MAG: hypothetical protein KDI03_21165 [Anaerolineae bacterium]|nr:hypothetical protein [Anaerolineae bacterium]